MLAKSAKTYLAGNGGSSQMKTSRTPLENAKTLACIAEALQVTCGRLADAV